MSAASIKPHATVDEYLRFERASQERHEYLDGDILAKAGESPSHGTITSNLVALLVSQLRGGVCQAWFKATKVRSGPRADSGKRYSGLFSYPDAVVVCGEPEFHDQKKDVLLNPKVILEVLSESTELFDRGEKFARFQKWNPTLSDYILIAQDRPCIEHYVRQSDGGWTYYRYDEIHAAAEIASIGCVLKRAEVYERIAFPEEEEGES